MPFTHEKTTYWTAKETAAFLGVDPTTLRGYLNKKLLPEPIKLQIGLRTVRGFDEQWAIEAKRILANAK